MRLQQQKHAMKAQDDKMIQTLPWNSEGNTSQRSSVSSLAPEHFSVEQLNKLESRFTHQKWPDREGLIIIAMECNLLVEDVELWFRTRREKWLQRLTDAITLAKDALTEHCSNNLN